MTSVSLESGWGEAEGVSGTCENPNMLRLSVGRETSGIIHTRIPSRSNHKPLTPSSLLFLLLPFSLENFYPGGIWAQGTTQWRGWILHSLFLMDEGEHPPGTSGTQPEPVSKLKRRREVLMGHGVWGPRMDICWQEENTNSSRNLHLPHLGFVAPSNKIQESEIRG